MASDRFDFTSQNKFSLARLFFLHNLALCLRCVILAELKTVNMPLGSLWSEELEC